MFLEHKCSRRLDHLEKIIPSLTTTYRNTREIECKYNPQQKKPWIHVQLTSITYTDKRIVYKKKKLYTQE